MRVGWSHAGMASKGDIRDSPTNLVVMRQEEGILEKVFTHMLRYRDHELEERAAKGIAHLSIMKQRQVGPRFLRVRVMPTGTGPIIRNRLLHIGFLIFR